MDSTILWLTVRQIQAWRISHRISAIISYGAILNPPKILRE